MSFSRPTKPLQQQQQPSPPHQDRRTSSINRSNKKYFILAFLNHIIWSTHPVSSRYLQVYATPLTFDGQAVLCTSKLMSALVVCFGSSLLCPDSDNEKRKTRRRNDGDIKEEEEDKNGKNQNHASSLRTKVFYLVLFGTVATCRASLNIASANFTLSYNISTINSLTPIFVSLGDTLLFHTKLPSALWPSILLSTLGCITIALSQSPFFFHNDNDDDNDNKTSHVFTIRDTIGCTLQFTSMIFSSIARLLMKSTEHILSRDAMVQANNICNFLLPLLYTLLTNPSGWESFLYLNVYSVMAWLSLGLLVYGVGSIGQMSLVRQMGPGLYSSLSAIRVLGSVLFSALFLGECVKNWLEWIGLFVTMITMTVYTVVSMDDDDDGKKETSFSSSGKDGDCCTNEGNKHDMEEHECDDIGDVSEEQSLLYYRQKIELGNERDIYDSLSSEDNK